MQAQEVLDGTSDDVLAELIALNGSSAGARPKALIGVNDKRDHIIHGVHDLPAGYTPWMVKFPNSQDGLDAGAIEYVYALMAKEAGVSMPDVHLFPAKRGTGYFAIKRFDRDGDKRYHMHTACGLLHSDFRTPSLDYEDLVALTGMLTRDVREVEKLYQLAVFNVLAHNRDDHSKNFSYLMDSQGRWKISPAYDLTFSSGPRGNLLPEDKLAAIKDMQQRYGATGMSGDGINDAPALAQADIGFAMGGMGTDIAMEAADVVIMNDDLRRIASTIRLSRATHAVLWQNIALALGIKAVFLVLAVFGNATMWMAVFADMGASLLVVFNGLRLLRTNSLLHETESGPSTKTL